MDKDAYSAHVHAGCSTDGSLLPLIPFFTCRLGVPVYLQPIELEQMDFFQWHWWAGLGLVLCIAEIFVPGFWLLCLGIGCIGGSITAAVHLGPSAQLLAFSAMSLVAFFTIRPLLMKRMWKDTGVRTNVDALVGQRGRVTQDFEPGLRLGRVSAAGDDWRAECTTDRALRIGDLVDVVRVESNTLIVKPVDPA